MVNITDIIAPSSIRIIAGTALPGAVGVWPYFALAYGKFPWVESVIIGWPWAIVAAIILLIYCAGMAFNSLGTTMEDAMYNKLVNKPDPTVKQYWQNYLLNDPAKFPIFHKYYGLLVTWLCFSRAMTFAVLALLIGTSWHAYCWQSFTCCELVICWNFGVVGCGWMMGSTWSCVKCLHEMREILAKEGERMVTGSAVV